MKISNLSFNEKDIESLAKKWGIIEFSIFGSVLGNHFKDDSDIDILIQFKSDIRYSLFDLVELKEELEDLFHRPVDIVEKASIKNPFRKNEILKTARVIYAA
jgi:hypothetical protein